MSEDKKTGKPNKATEKVSDDTPEKPVKEIAKEIGGPSGPEPTRFGDWEKNGRCSDF